MDIEGRITAFARLGDFLGQIEPEVLEELLTKVGNQNPWFTRQSVNTALTGIRKLLGLDHLIQWTAPYSFSNDAKSIALVLAGNIPMAGFHDVLSVLISGNKAIIKCSSKDSFLIPFLADRLTDIEPRFKERILFAEKLKDFDAVIATGSDNSSRYFDYYFGKHPHIIRKNRSSCAVLTGSESREELMKLGNDVFTYFGLGCRNVSKLFVPMDYNFSDLITAWKGHEDIIHHHKYCNNYDYQKALVMINRTPFVDGGFVLLQESENIVSPISVVFYEHYENESALAEKIKSVESKIQCVVGNGSSEFVPFGQAQYPEVWDYADRVDTLRFLSAL